MAIDTQEFGSNPAIQEKEAPKPLHFRQEVAVKDLPYIFEGDIPVKPADFEWSVSVPNWEDQKSAAEEMMKKGEIAPGFDHWLESHKLGNGRVGVLEINNLDTPDHVPAIRVDMIQTETAHLPEKFGYNNAEGVGSFLLDNLCALADLNGWRIYLNPVDKGGKLTQGPLYSWYKRRGFDDPYKFPKGSDYDGDMQRWPKQPDISQPIISIVESGKAK
ncbi:hypothetical protein A3H85_02940 [Candidatus Daviesbacteria bacterium RIFCSPLOWO2_02_FULL_40_8]|uniref:Uncharacterized protein n=1 Tax=Candidatus Daviesbacteria bacterium RIFCSPLOWO2_01_FULL_40_24 TaxID=1797787 RepID=A0A1F5MJX6_9BACT|nr:MAG: hypothetical protein A2780_01740 [Candidatus Daviesbacteria bacterium RIFCSPHIGHO2_01_FULL_41_45]OGE35376.1 MAG: hypothetical protein A3C32_01840 [Candidatus Daviesbacteria bacterium RIFCSPHIGHO2_02_FULL_41_14]OGE65619.1 MAG: hypothetical protein A3B49_02940 [Candidatus Daviesbacteria bacterium RIFCSPLOWO2_01_FULL_40_24]OGE66298.1 MAG: hypothetical protein A3H85_02940 [Candidatus Daviesbacteria bacterium RIFCSPLOWO2_02_FULL_40_8]